MTRMSNTVDWQGLKLQTLPEVYEPREDSFLLASIAREKARGLVLDLGCGSGIVGISAAANPAVVNVLAADINPKAVELAKKNAERNGVAGKMNFVHSNLFSSFPARRFDTILFNPPYLPKEPGVKVEGEIGKALESGKTGRVLLDRFLHEFAKHLTPSGQLVLLNSSVSSSKGDGTGNQETIAKLQELGFKAQRLASQRFFFEEIVVLHAQREG